MLTVRAFERFPMDGVVPSAPVFGHELIGAVRMLTAPGEIYAVVVWVEDAPNYRAIYWERNERRFAYHALDPALVMALWPERASSPDPAPPQLKLL